VKPAVPLRNWAAVTSGYDIEHLLSRYCDTSGGRLAYYYYMLNKVFGSICLMGHLPITLDTPVAGRGGPYVNFMKVGDALMRRGESKVLLGIAQTGRVQVHVSAWPAQECLLADRVFPRASRCWRGTAPTPAKVAAAYTSCAARRAREGRCSITRPGG
jgi:hypothetical protein